MIAYLPIAIAFAVGIVVVGLLPMLTLRVVVTTNSVHIVQTSKKTTSYGRGQSAGNTYYRWPAWLPVLGVRVTILPVSIFDRKLIDYGAYDVDRVPFVIDVVGFFRISDSNAAAERVKDFAELEEQLEPILQGAARTILATSTINEILGSRAVFAEKFTSEVTKDLASWGVEPVKSIELMDIRDAAGSQVISNIMMKKKSFIEMESRVAVAQNAQAAQTAEINAQREVLLRRQEAEEQVGQRTAAKEQAVGTAQADRDQMVGIAEQKAQQAIQEQAKETAARQMAVTQVNKVRAAEIERDAQVVAADQAKQVAIVSAEGRKQAAIKAAEATQQQTVITADGEKQRVVLTAEADKQKLTLTSEGALAAATNEAVGVQKLGESHANAAKLMNLAPVEAQITLAKEIGANEGYQHYLISIRTVEASQVVGVEQAKALEKANVKIVATAADASSGLNLVSRGNGVGAIMDAFKNSNGEAKKPNGAA